jgi:chemotaxis protein CheD
MTTHIAGLGEMVASRTRGDRLVAFGLGSCVAVVLSSPRTGWWALGHVVLPGPQPAGRMEDRAVYYATPGLQRLLDDFAARTGPRDRPVVSLYGGATAPRSLGAFDIGRRNVLTLRRLLWQLGYVPEAEDVEGTVSRTVSIIVGDRLTVTSPPTSRASTAPLRGQP